MKKIYISGKITGLDIKEAELLFLDAENYLRVNRECFPVNPMRLVPYKKGKLWNEYMVDDLRLIFECDSIYMLSNWEDSKGAKIEHFIAKEIGLEVIYQGRDDETIKPEWCTCDKVCYRSTCTQIGSICMSDNRHGMFIEDIDNTLKSMEFNDEE